MRLKLIVLVGGLVLAGLLTGCETPLPPGAEPGPSGTMAYNILIEASEPGARIEVNREHVGNAPLNLKIFGDRDGTFHNFGSYEYLIQAFPLVTNQYAQTRVYRTGDVFMPEDRIPDRIFFDMNVQQPTVVPVYAPQPYYPYAYPYYGYPYYYGPRFNFYWGGGYGGYYGGHHHHHHSHGIHAHGRH